MKTFDYFNTLPLSTLQSIESFSFTKHLSKGSRLYEQGEIVDKIYLLKKGTLSYVRYCEESVHPMLLFSLKSGCDAIDFSYTPAQSEAIASVMAKTDCELIVIDAVKLFSLLKEESDFMKFVCAELMKRTHYLAKLAQDLRFSPLDKRILDWIYEHGSKTIHITHEEVALVHGTSREVVSRLLKRFEKAGYIKLGRGHIKRVA